MDDAPRGIAFMIAATIFFAVSNTIAKWEVALYPPGEVLFVRSLSSFALCAAFLLPLRGWAAFATRRVRDHLARGFAQSISQGLTVLALGLLPLAAATAISFSAPLWAALVAMVFLREKVSLERWGVLAIGLVGILLITQPGVETFSLGAIFALGNAVMYGSITVAVRGMTRTETTDALLMWQLACLAFFHAFLLPLGFSWPTPQDALLLMAGGVANVGAQVLWTRALALAPASAVSPFYYLLLVWSLAIGFLAWGDIPSPALLAGSAVVVASGLLLLWHEKRCHRAATRIASLRSQAAARDEVRPAASAASAPGLSVAMTWSAGPGLPR